MPALLPHGPSYQAGPCLSPLAGRSERGLLLGVSTASGVVHVARRRRRSVANSLVVMRYYATCCTKSTHLTAAFQSLAPLALHGTTNQFAYASQHELKEWLTIDSIHARALRFFRPKATPKRGAYLAPDLELGSDCEAAREDSPIERAHFGLSTDM